MGFAPGSVTRILHQIEPFGFFIIVGLLLSGLLNPVINLLMYFILKVISVVLH
jgi:hypothetical protein